MFFLSFIMLLGTTYAWFSETITVADNTIKTGKFDVAMAVQDPSEGQYYDLLSETTKIFDNNYLYPGFTDARVVKVQNVGQIDAKVRFIITDGTTVDEELLNYVIFTVTVPGYRTFQGTYRELTSFWIPLAANANKPLTGQAIEIGISYEILPTLGNAGQEKVLQFNVTLEAQQFNYR